MTPVRLALHDAAAGADHQAAVAGHLVQHGGLHLAEARLAVLSKDLCHRLPRGTLHQRVAARRKREHQAACAVRDSRIQVRVAQALRQQAADSGLAAVASVRRGSAAPGRRGRAVPAHHADKKQRGALQLVLHFARQSLPPSPGESSPAHWCAAKLGARTQQRVWLVPAAPSRMAAPRQSLRSKAAAPCSPARLGCPVSARR